LPKEIVDHPRTKRTRFPRVRDLIFDLVTGAPNTTRDSALVFRIAFELLTVDASDVVGGATRGGTDARGSGDRRCDQKACGDDGGARKKALRESF
jgi:hypothetical protein